MAMGTPVLALVLRFIVMVTVAADFEEFDGSLGMKKSRAPATSTTTTGPSAVSATTAAAATTKELHISQVEQEVLEVLTRGHSHKGAEVVLTDADIQQTPVKKDVRKAASMRAGRPFAARKSRTTTTTAVLANTTRTTTTTARWIRGKNCAQLVPVGDASIWRPGWNRRWHSCSIKEHGHFAQNLDIRTDSARMCLDESGNPDYTSLFVDMESVDDPTGCFAWIADQCPIDLRHTAMLEFDIDVAQCENLWTSPLWLSPLVWRFPQGLSGEVDLVEMCPVPNITTNLGCWSLGAAKDVCTDGVDGAWGTNGNLDGKKHVLMTLEDGRDLQAKGGLLVRVCDESGSCVKVAYKVDFLSASYPTAGQKNGWPLELRSSVWNGYPTPEDGGWSACKAVHNPLTKCKYLINNIKVTSNTGIPMFSGKCAPLNAR